MRNSCKILMLLCLLGFSFGSCTTEDNAIYDEPLEVLAGDENQDADQEPEPN